MKYAIIAPRIFTGEALLEDHAVVVDGATICDVLPSTALPDSLQRQTLTNGILAPGFIDLQVNGGGGVMLNNTPSRLSVDQITAAHRNSGTTAMLPTVISDTPGIQRAALEAVTAARDGGNRGVLGIHFEGPHIATDRRGIHSNKVLRQLEQSDIDWLTAIKGHQVLLTLAPELATGEQLAHLSHAGIHLCAGHTAASHAQLQSAARHGLKGFTHLFNAMSQITPREPGAVGAALDLDDTWAGIIVDGHHVDVANVRLAWRSKPAGKLFLVTDAMATVGGDQDFFELYGERITVSDGCLINAEGRLAGSAIGMIDAVRIAHQQVGIPLPECLRMASLYPAQFLSIDDHLGKIATNYRCDLVHFTADFSVTDTWVAGERLTTSPSV